MQWVWSDEVWSDELVAVLKDKEIERGRSRPVPLVGYRVEDGIDIDDFAERVIVGENEGRMDTP